VLAHLAQTVQWHLTGSSPVNRRVAFERDVHRQAIGFAPTLCRCLQSTNLIDSSQSGVRQKTQRVTNWQNGQMALRWAAASFQATAKSFRKIMGHQQLWMLKAYLDAPVDQRDADADVAIQRRAG